MQNQYVLPGIINAHTRISNVPTYWAKKETTIKDADSKAMQIIFAIKNMQDIINNGITYIRNVEAAYDLDIPIKIMQQQKMIVGPRVMTSGRAFIITGGVLRNGETPDDIQFNADEIRAAFCEAHSPS